jgi:uncharacterized membrane protein YgcG
MWRRVTIAVLIVVVSLTSVQPGLTTGLSPDSPLAQPVQTPDADESLPEPVPAKPDKFDRVYDVPGRLNKKEYDRFHFDIGRMWNDGLPAVIYIRESGEDASTSQQFADQLRTKWDIESSPGADDGLVMLVTIRDRFPKTAILTLSYGSNAFPQGQMTVDVLNTILEEEAYPRIRTGNINGGLTYAVRRILYYSEYTAPFPPPLTDRQETLHRLATPLASIVAIILIGLIVVPAKRLPGWLREKEATFVLAALLVALALAVAVLGRHALASGIAITDIVLLLGLFAVRSRHDARTAQVTAPVRVITRVAQAKRRSRQLRSVRRV